jgi:predicted RNA-binding protein associated with RNAse of E/G family
VYLFWSDANDAFSGYYIDLIEPFQRTPVGFDTRDHVLDIWIELDRRTWTWKDEDELAWQIEIGRMSQQEADAIRAEGVRAVNRVLGSTEYEQWKGCRPDPSWTTPVFPSDWQTIFSTHE